MNLVPVSQTGFEVGRDPCTEFIFFGYPQGNCEQISHNMIITTHHISSMIADKRYGAGMLFQRVDRDKMRTVCFHGNYFTHKPTRDRRRSCMLKSIPLFDVRHVFAGISQLINEWIIPRNIKKSKWLSLFRNETSIVFEIFFAKSLSQWDHCVRLWS